MNELQAHQAALLDATAAAAAARAAVEAHAITDPSSAGVHDTLVRSWVRQAGNQQAIAQRVGMLLAG